MSAPGPTLALYTPMNIETFKWIDLLFIVETWKQPMSRKSRIMYGLYIQLEHHHRRRLGLGFGGWPKIISLAFFPNYLFLDNFFKFTIKNSWWIFLVISLLERMLNAVTDSRRLKWYKVYMFFSNIGRDVYISMGRPPPQTLGDRPPQFPLSLRQWAPSFYTNAYDNIRLD